jgi:hypothetical protein
MRQTRTWFDSKSMTLYFEKASSPLAERHYSPTVRQRRKGVLRRGPLVLRPLVIFLPRRQTGKTEKCCFESALRSFCGQRSPVTQRPSSSPSHLLTLHMRASVRVSRTQNRTTRENDLRAATDQFCLINILDAANARPTTYDKVFKDIIHAAK